MFCLARRGAKRAQPSPGTPAYTAEEGDMMDEDAFLLDKVILAEDEAALLMVQRDEALPFYLRSVGVYSNWQDFIPELDPDVIIGYNVCNDLPYLFERAVVLKSGVPNTWPNQK